MAFCKKITLQGSKRNFCWLLLKLLPCNPQIKGCELIIPETAIFSNGKPQIVIRNDKNYFVSCVTNKVKVQLAALQKEFFNIWTQRKKDNFGLFG